MGNITSDMYQKMSPADRYGWLTGRREGGGLTQEQALAKLRSEGISYSPAVTQPTFAPHFGQLFQDILRTFGQLQNSWGGIVGTAGNHSIGNTGCFATAGSGNAAYQAANQTNVAVAINATPPPAQGGGAGVYG